MSLASKVASRFAVEVKTAEAFAQQFFGRHPGLKRYAPKKVKDKQGGSGSHPEARQHGDEVWLYPKFWDLTKDIQEFVFTHELGHYALSRKGSSELITAGQKVGIDMWDSSNLPFGQFNMEEAFADAFATYHLNKSELQTRYPSWVKVVEDILD